MNVSYSLMGRVISKSVITAFEKSKTFSVVLFDGTAKVRVTVWTHDLCELFYPKFEVYFILIYHTKQRLSNLCVFPIGWQSLQTDEV